MQFVFKTKEKTYKMPEFGYFGCYVTTDSLAANSSMHFYLDEHLEMEGTKEAINEYHSCVSRYYKNNKSFKYTYNADHELNNVFDGLYKNKVYVNSYGDVGVLVPYIENKENIYYVGDVVCLISNIEENIYHLRYLCAWGFQWLRRITISKSFCYINFVNKIEYKGNIIDEYFAKKDELSQLCKIN